MQQMFSRTVSLVGQDALKKLNSSSVAVFGVGGVGGYVLEALVRAGVGKICVVDGDKISLTNLNRQILATHSTVGKSKVEVARERALDINPQLEITAREIYFTPQTESEFDFSSFDYVVDAIDMVTGKIALAEKCKKVGVPLISSMGTGNKLNATAFEVADIYSTSVCPLARVMRTELKKRGIEKLKVVYSKEQPITPTIEDAEEKDKRRAPSSISFVPSVAGLIIAGEVIKDLIAKK